MFWGTLPRSMMTLYKTTTGGIEWGEPGDSLADLGVYSGIYLIYVSINILLVMNIMTAIFCQSAIEQGQLDIEKTLRKSMEANKHKIHDMRMFFKMIDLDSS